MTDEQERVDLEMEKLKLERFKVWEKIITVIISVTIGTFGVAYMNYVIQQP